MKIWRKIGITAVLLLGLCSPVFAQFASIDTPVTVGTSSALCVPGANRSTLSMTNISSGSTIIWYCRAAANSTCTAAANTAGSWPLYPGQIVSWPWGSAPTNPFYCIAASSTPMTVGVQ